MAIKNTVLMNSDQTSCADKIFLPRDVDGQWPHFDDKPILMKTLCDMSEVTI